MLPSLGDTCFTQLFQGAFDGFFTSEVDNSTACRKLRPSSVYTGTSPEDIPLKEEESIQQPPGGWGGVGGDILCNSAEVDFIQHGRCKIFQFI